MAYRQLRLCDVESLAFATVIAAGRVAPAMLYPQAALARNFIVRIGSKCLQLAGSPSSDVSQLLREWDAFLVLDAPFNWLKGSDATHSYWQRAIEGGAQHSGQVVLACLSIRVSEPAAERVGSQLRHLRLALSEGRLHAQLFIRINARRLGLRIESTEEIT